jgi:nucleoside-diphosphate-sugar epimerase
VEGLGRGVLDAVGRLPVRLPVLVPDLPVQFVHEDDVGDALHRCVVGEGPPGAYNIAGDGVLRMPDVVRELGFAAVPLPTRASNVVARAVSQLPLPSVAQWVEAASHAPVMDTTKAKTELGWTPRYTGLEALQDTARHWRGQA